MEMIDSNREQSKMIRESSLLPFTLVRATQNHNLFPLQNVESGRRVLTKQEN